MKEKVSAILNLMKLMNVRVEDLIIYNGQIEQSGKFPLEVFYSDRTRSFDVSHSQESKRHPLGVIINNIVYALGGYVSNERSCEIPDFLQSQWYYDMWVENYQGALSGELPTSEQVDALNSNMMAYNQINAFFGMPLFERDSVAISCDEQLKDSTLCYYLKSKQTYKTSSCAYVLPVHNLKK